MRILVVDDEVDERQYVASLAAGFGHQVIEAVHGRQALERLAEQTVAVMVTDMRMPQMDGLELIRELRAQGNLPPTLVLTGFGSQDLAVSTVHELGAFWFLEKPIQPSVLRVLCALSRLIQLGVNSCSFALIRVKTPSSVHGLRSTVLRPPSSAFCS